jgi:uncharacterized membrane protein
MITGLFHVVGVMLLVIGLLLLLRAMGLVNRNSPFFKYRVRIGGFLMFVGRIILVLSLILSCVWD